MNVPKFLPFADRSRVVRDGVFLVCLIGLAVAVYLRFDDFAIARHKTAPAEVGSPSKVISAECNLTFTQRSPLSNRHEIARRLSLDETDMGADYDLAKCPFKAYVPISDPAVPYAVLVYLGYKDSVSVATPWEPVLDKSHMIFITPVCHHGSHYSPSVSVWQMLGLAFDAVDNLKSKYKIDPHRIYLMAWEGGMQTAFASTDVFTGDIITYDAEYFRPLSLSDGRFYPPAFPSPPDELYQQARSRPIVLIDQGFDSADKMPRLILDAMKADGFTHVLTKVLSLGDDLHYPNLKSNWFEQDVLPFLDKCQPSDQP
jgi:hypothetical protein